MPHRYFSKNITPQEAILLDADARHFAVVMRGKVGEEVLVCDGNGTDYVCKAAAITPQEVRLEVVSFAKSVSEPTKQVTLYVGYPKGDKLELIVQKATELGAVRIVPFFSRFCVVKPKKEEQKNERYQRIAFEAAKQSGRGVVPEVALPLTYTQMLKEAAAFDTALFCYEGGGAPLHSRLEQCQSIAIITGSEGGFSAEEAAAAVAAGCTSIGLGPRILRCETAAVAALTAVMTLTGNLQ